MGELNRELLNKPVQLNVDITMEEIMVMLDQLDHDDLVEFIKIVDLQAADWGVTEDLYAHFHEQHKLFKEEEERDNE